jgi:hypothetical protein
MNSLSCSSTWTAKIFFLKFLRKSNYCKEIKIKISVATRYEEQDGWTELTKKNTKIKRKYFVGLLSKKIWFPWKGIKCLLYQWMPM